MCNKLSYFFLLSVLLVSCKNEYKPDISTVRTSKGTEFFSRILLLLPVIIKYRTGFRIVSSVFLSIGDLHQCLPMTDGMPVICMMSIAMYITSC